jgi:hypothetical protein
MITCRPDDEPGRLRPNLKNEGPMYRKTCQPCCFWLGGRHDYRTQVISQCTGKLSGERLPRIYLADISESNPHNPLDTHLILAPLHLDNFVLAPLLQVEATEA